MISLPHPLGYFSDERALCASIQRRLAYAGRCNELLRKGLKSAAAEIGVEK